VSWALGNRGSSLKSFSFALTYFARSELPLQAEAHLYRDFSAFAGTTPTAFRASQPVTSVQDGATRLVSGRIGFAILRAEELSALGRVSPRGVGSVGFVPAPSGGGVSGPWSEGALFFGGSLVRARARISALNRRSRRCV
jgi:hypothetical protein